MSFDLFVHCVRNKELSRFPQSLLEEILGRNAVSPSFPLDRVEYPAGSGGEVYGGEDEEIEDLMFTHFGGNMMFEAIHELARRTGSLIFWPDTRPSLAVTDALVIDHIPPDYMDAVGPVHIVEDHRALMDYINRPG